MIKEKSRFRHSIHVYPLCKHTQQWYSGQGNVVFTLLDTAYAFFCGRSRIHPRGQSYVTFSLLSATNANALPATSDARGTECYWRSVGLVSLVVGLPFAPCLRELAAGPIFCSILMILNTLFLIWMLQHFSAVYG